MVRVSTTPRRVAAALGLVTALLVAGCSGAGQQPSAGPASTTAPQPAPPSSTPPEDPATLAATLVGELADEDLVGQVLMPYAYGDHATKVSAGSAAGNRALAGVDTPAEMIEKYRLGGLILVGFSADDPTQGNQETTNVDDPKQVRNLTTGLREAAGRLPAGTAPFLIGTDQEYGVVTRITDGVTMLPSALGAGAAGDPDLTEAAWRAAGTELTAMGINVDFAPVADVLVTRSAVIGSRSFGSDPQRARPGRRRGTRTCSPPGWPPPSSTSRGTGTAPSTPTRTCPGSRSPGASWRPRRGRRSPPASRPARWP